MLLMIFGLVPSVKIWVDLFLLSLIIVLISITSDHDVDYSFIYLA